MNREQKAAAIAEIAAQIEQAQAILAVDYRGISVPQVAQLRAGLREADATFRVVKNSLTERAAAQSGAEQLTPLLVGPTALTFVRGDVATAAKTLAEYGRSIQLLEFKGGVMDGAALDSDQLRALSRLPSREVLYGQLVGVVASPVSGLVRTLNALLGGLAAALGQVRDKMQTGEIPPGAPAAAEQATPDAQESEPESAEEAEASEAPEGEAQAADESEPQSAEEAEASEAPEGEAQAVQEGESAAAQEPEASAAPEGEAQAAQEGEAAGAAASESQEGEPGEPAAEQDQDDTQASGEASSDAAEPAKEE